jgi:transmembrane sensor
MGINEEHKKLITSYLSNQISQKELEELVIWLKQSESNIKYFNEYKRTWLLTSLAGAQKGKFNKAKYAEWDKLSARLNLNKKTIVRGISTYRILIRIAAVFLLLAATGSTIAWRITTYKLQQITSQETFQRITVPLGGKGEVTLPDGSTVTLNAGSELSYSGNFIANREVRLEGEGFFDIKTDPRRPFIVDAQGLKIHALGTVFNVRAYPGEDIITTLVEGLVRIKGDNIDLAMTPSQKVTYVKSQPVKVSPEEEEITEYSGDSLLPDKIKTPEPPKVLLANNINTQEITSWKNGIYIFKSERLNDLAVYLERRFDVSVKIESEELKNHVFSGTFHQETLEQILGIITLSAPISYKVEKGVVTIDLDSERSAVFKELSKN